MSDHPAFDHEPTDDWAILLCHFNPAGFRRPVHNLGAMLDWSHGNRLPVYAAELSFHDAAPVLPQAHSHILHFRLCESGVMFQKEALLSRLAVSGIIPERVCKYFICDADVVFSDPRAFESAALLLETARLVQPFTRAVWSDATGHPWVHKDGVAMAWNGKRRDHALNPQFFHTGFAIGVTREFFRQVGPLYGCPITGTGDVALWQAALAHLLPPAIKGGSHYSAPSPAAWKERVAAFVGGRVDAWPGDAIHFYHGSTVARAYDQRHKALPDFDPGRHLTTDPGTGLPVWTPEARHFEAMMGDYFRSRREDG